MPKCDVRSNDYDKTFQITQAGRTLTFYSFESAIHAMAPSCARCGCRIIGHGAVQMAKSIAAQIVPEMQARRCCGTA
jgi:hypothetical protein